MVKNHSKKHGASKKCQKMEINKTQILKFSQKTHQKTPLFKTQSAAFLDKIRQRLQRKQRGICKALPLLFARFWGILIRLRRCGDIKPRFLCSAVLSIRFTAPLGTSCCLFLHFLHCFCVLLGLYSAI